MHPLEDPNDRLDEVDKLLTDLGTLNVGGLSAKQLGGLLCRMERVRDLSDALRCELAAEATNAGVPTLDALRRVGDYVALHTPASPAAVSRDNTYGQWVRGYPIFRAAMQAGELSRDRLDLLKKCDNSRTRQHLLNDQSYLADAARDCSWRDFKTVLATWLLHRDPDGDEPKKQKEDRKAHVRKTGAGGMVLGGFQLDAINGHQVHTAVWQEVRRMQAQDDALGVTRTTEQRMADAVFNLITRGAARPDGTLPAPLLHIIMGIRTARELLLRFDRQPCDPEPTDGPIPVSTTDPDWRCELVDGTPIHPYAAYQYLGQANIRRIIVDTNPNNPLGRAEIVDLSKNIRPHGSGLNAALLTSLMSGTPSVPLESPRRLFPPHLRLALFAAGRGHCDNHGCNSSHHFLQADHIHPASKGGKTHVHNGKLLCQVDNGTKDSKLPPHLVPRNARHHNMVSRK